MEANMNTALFNLGFRPFFLVGAAFAVFSMALWVGPFFPTALMWHAHEMVYGFAVAIVAGFLLTAVRNWTGIQTLYGLPLAGLVGIWLSARLLALSKATLPWAAVLDLVFLLALWAAVSWPIVQVKQRRQWGILTCLGFVVLGQLIFALGEFEVWRAGQRTGILIGLYAVLGLIFILGRRVIPFFTERGVGYPVTVKQYPWLDRWLMPIYSLFAVLVIVFPEIVVDRLLAMTLAVLHGIRLAGWHTPGIWRKPLLWILFLAYGWLIIGFALYGAGMTSLAVHAFAVGGLGGMILGMICRVSLGHTGRNIHQPPKAVDALFLLLMTAAVFRTAMPLFFSEYTVVWYRLAGITWIAAYLGFLWWYAPMLWQPRVDGKPG